MKLKSVLLGLLFSLVLIPSFSSAFENTFYPYVPVQINDWQSNTLQLTDNVNFLLNDSYKVISVYWWWEYPRLKNVFWNWTWLYFIDSCAGGYSCSNINTSIMKQWFIQKYYECTLNDSICNVSNTPLKDVSEFIWNSNYSSPDYMFISDTRWNNSSLFVCFKYSSLNTQICFQFDETSNYYSNSLWFTYNPKPSQYWDSNNQIVEYFSNSPFSSSSQPIQYYYSTWSCPSVWQLKAWSNLSPAVCYWGYGSNVMYWDQVAFQWWTWMNIFEIYLDYLNSSSSNVMNIQTWYDTYWAYYQNIAHDSRPFEWLKKSYLWLQFARQTFGNTQWVNWSYVILNYCYYIINNTSDNQSTCVWSNVSTQYSWITFTDQDRKDIIDMVNDNYVVHTPSTWSIFDWAPDWWWTSRGDEQCSWIPCLFEKFYQMFTSSRINDVNFSEWGQGILPQYIALAFVVVVLFYVFKR